MTGADPLLDVRGLEKRFGAVAATAGIDLQVRAGEIHALIGPNGAGKTTVVQQIGGQLRPDRGTIRFDGIDITSEPPHRRARRGIARSFQITRLFGSATVLDNALLAVLAVAGSAWSPWRPVRREAALIQRAREALAEVGLATRHDAPVATLAWGERRALEVAMTLASKPRLVLLDEPMAGLGIDESVRMEALIDLVRKRSAVLLIEHDVDAVFRLADRVSVLVNGRVIASGAADAVRADPDVLAAYLGETAVDAVGGRPPVTAP